MVVRAVRSALAQTYAVKEIVVVVDGPDDLTVKAIEDFDDARVRCLVLPVNGGSNNARNQGVANSTSEWIAFLDDDDEWLPEKIAVQMALTGDYDVIACRFYARFSKGTAVWPKRLPRDGERFGDYMFSRRSIFNGEAALITSTLLVRRSLLQQVPFSTKLRRHQDTDWMIRVAELGTRTVYASEPLLIFNDDLGRVRISTSYNWHQSLEWIRSVKELMGKQAYSGFVLTSIGSAASDQNDRSAFLLLLKEAFRYGRPTPLHLALYLGMWAFPQSFRQRVKSILAPPARRQASAS